MRKRAQRKTKPILEEPRHVTMKTRITKEKKSFKLTSKKNWWIAVSLVGIFLLVLFLNTYFNFTSEIAINHEAEGLDKFYLSGPDPYYNRRIVETTYETGRYPYYSEEDPLLNYPLGRTGARPPLFNMMALGFSRLLTPFMDEIDAIGYSMHFIPALFGALLIFPVYFIGKEIFNRKAGLIGALFIALIPIHLSSGHGSAYSLFDHDSFNLLLFFLTFLFLVKSLKEKDSAKSILYAIIGGVALAALAMTWVKANYLFVLVAIYAFVQMFIDIFRNKIDFGIFRTSSVLMFSGYLISLPVITAGYGNFRPDVNLYLCLGVTIFGIIYYTFRLRRIPWTIGLPAVFCVGGAALVILHPSILDKIISNVPFLAPLSNISDILYGLGIYGNKVSMTIAEANTYQISHSVMSFGPAMYWLGWTGFVFLIWFFYKNMERKDYLFILVLFLMNIWLSGIAGRFINDMVPVIAMLSGWIVWMLLDKIDYQQMIRNIRSAGGGLHGIRRGVKFLHVFGICFIAFLVLLPNAFMAFDAAIPLNAPTDDPEKDYKEAMFGASHVGAFGLGIGKERYWYKAFEWLSQQDQHIENPAERPAFISWWDYGFYEVAMGEHPTVADNFQDGIPPASNFHTATSEEEAVAILIVRLLEGDVKHNGGKLSANVKSNLTDHLGLENATKIISWIENPATSPSYNKPIDPQYHKYITSGVSTQHLNVGSQWPEIAAYHDIVDFLTNTTYGLSDEEITMLYHDLQQITGWSIRYYGVEGYDKQIFNIFAFLSDKSLLMVGAPIDDFVEVTIKGEEIDPNTKEVREGREWEMTLLNYLEMSDSEWEYVETLNSGSRQLNKKYMAPTDQSQQYLDPYFNTMFYRTYFGPEEEIQRFDVQIPCDGMKHFYAEYMSDLSKPDSQFFRGISAVVIAKYYEGAIINGTLLFNEEPWDSEAVIAKEIAYTSDVSFNISHDRMDTINGSFNLIAGTGAKLHIRRYPEIDLNNPWVGETYFVVKEIDLNITDDDAMRKTDNWRRELGNITIEPANIDGFVYNNLDDNESYNASADEPIKNASMYIYEVLEFDENELKNTGRLVPVENQATFAGTATTDENGYYNFTNLFPGYYVIQTYVDDFQISNILTPLISGNHSINISKPKPGALEGIVYLDKDGDNEIDDNEKISDANIELYHTSLIVGKKVIGTNTTKADGSYSFTSLIPGEYTLNITKENPTTGYLDYSVETTVTVEENKTKSFNVSLDFATIKVSGDTSDINGEPLGDIKIEFKPDETVEDITAVYNSATSNETTGYYQIDLKPGKYNVSAEKKEGDTIVYSYEGKQELIVGQGIEELNIVLEKKTVTISGQIKDDISGAIISGVIIEFKPDESVEDITAAVPGVPEYNDTTGMYSVELLPGYYNITVRKDEGLTQLYFYKEDSVKIENKSQTIDITINKKSVTVSGTISYGGTAKENITLLFSHNTSVIPNNAVDSFSRSDETGYYTVELTPGSYNISVLKEIFNKSGVNYSYTYSASLTVEDKDISTGIPKDIELQMKKEE